MNTSSNKVLQTGLRRSLATLLPAHLLVLLLSLGALGQVSTTVTEINPDQSSLDPNDPDGATGGRVNGLGVTRDGNTFYAASEWGGIFKSVDQGRNWRHLDSHLPTAMWDVEVDPSDSTKVYASSFYDGRVTSKAGINVSTNGGKTWNKPATATPPAGFCASTARRDEPSAFGIAIDPNATRNVYVGTNCGLAVSNNAGLTWNWIDPTPADPADNIWDVIVHHGGIIDLCGDDGHQRSTDGGTTWTTATGAGLPAGRCSIAVSPDESYVLFTVVGTTIRESDDAGATWPTVIQNPRSQGRIPFVTTNNRTGSAFDLWFGDVQLHRASCTTPATPAIGGAARCPTNTWVGPFTRGSGGHDDSGDISFDPSSSQNACPVLFSSDGGVYFNTVSTTPGCHSPTWEQPTLTPDGLWVFGMAGADQAGSANEDLYFGNQDNGSFGTTNAGAAVPTWTNRDCCDSFDMAADPNQVVYTVCCFAGRSNRLFVRNSGMAGGAEVNTYPAGNLPGFRWGNIVANFAANSYVLITTSGVFVTNNISANPVVWTQLGAATSPANARAVKVSRNGATPVFYVQAGQSDGRTRDQIWRFNGTGAGNWQQINPPGGAGGFGIFDVDPNEPDRIIASHLQVGAQPAMVMTTDAGQNWLSLASLDDMMTGGGAFQYQNQIGPTRFTGFSGYPQPTLVGFAPHNRNIIVAGGADSGVFLSVDRGVTWTLVTDPNAPCCSGKPHIPRPRFVYFDVELSLISPFLTQRTTFYIGSQGRGVWRVNASWPGRRLVDICRFIDCVDVVMDRGVIKFECPDLGMCIGIDPIPKNCLVKYECPGCGPSGLCPPFYHMFFEDLNPDEWDVQLFGPTDDDVKYHVSRVRNGLVLSFRPSEGNFKPKSIGDYRIAFIRNGKGRGQKVSIRTRLEVGDGPFKGGRLIQTRSAQPL